MKHFLVLAVFSICFATASQAEDASCKGPGEEKLLQEKTATAGFLANARGAEGSIRAESGRLLEAALSGVSAATPPKGVCKPPCAPGKEPKVVFSSVPHAFKSGYSDEAQCDELFRQTQAAPFVYRDRTFVNVSELTEWFNNFSQGKGDDGKNLYKRCPGECSPQYKILVEKKSASYQVTAEVHCGPARDKDDNQYELTSAYRWECE